VRKIEEEWKPAELTESNLLWQDTQATATNIVLIVAYGPNGRLLITLGCLFFHGKRTTSYNPPRVFRGGVVVDLNYNTACDSNNCHPQGTERICLFFWDEVRVPKSISIRRIIYLRV
jgi:hypothetical protein